MIIEGINIKTILVGMVRTNCYIIYKDTNCILVDPGGEPNRIMGFLEESKLKPEAILLTHGHFDHILGLNECKETYHCKVYAMTEEQELLSDPNMNCSKMATGLSSSVVPDVLLNDQETINVAGVQIKVIYTPGHTNGSCCYYFEKEGFLLSGDTLFMDSIGRTDLPSGSYEKIIQSIKQKLFVLPDDVKVFPGHGMSTSIGYEKK